jgi:hypothetical protein
MDTLFTVAMSFYGGLLCGIVTGVLTNLVFTYSIGVTEFLYAFCSVAVALITILFIRLFPAELRFGPGKKDGGKTGGFEIDPGNSPFKTAMNTLVVLLWLSFIMCVSISMLGGCIAALIKTFLPLLQNDTGPERLFKLVLLRKNLPLSIAEVMSRIPLNIIDRLLSVFGGYGAAALFWWIKPRPAPP